MCNMYAELVLQFKTAVILTALFLTVVTYPSLDALNANKYHGVVEYHCRYGGGRTGKFVAGAAAIPFAYGKPPLVRDDDKLVFASHVKKGNIDQTTALNPLKFVANLPLRTLGPSLNYHNLKLVSKLHAIDCTGRPSGTWLLHELVNHVCGQSVCGNYVTIFTIDQKVGVDVLKYDRERKVIMREEERKKKLNTVKQSERSARARAKVSDALSEKKQA